MRPQETKKSSSSNAVPQPLPPSVEEAYRRKCCQLRHRYNQIEEHNDAARLRLHRLRRQLDKLRVERAFLLEQISKRTSMNVEDSDGSPSPPPTPKEKPLRTKRGHRKPSLIPDLDLSKPAGSTPLSQGQNLSPSSENFSQDKVNGIAKPKKPSNAFEIYCGDKTDEFKEKNQDKEDFDLEAELARGWKDLPEKEKEEFQAKYEDALEQYQKDMEAYTKKKEKEKEEKEKEKEKAAKKSGDADTQGADTEPEGDRDHDIDMDAKEAGAEEGGDKETPSADKDAAGKKSAEKTPPADHDEEMEEAQGDDEKAKVKDAEEETAEEDKQPQDSASQDDDVEMVDHPDEKK